MSLLELIPQTERETLKFRLLALLVVALAFLFQAHKVPLFPTLGIVAGYLVYSYVLRAFLIPRFTSYLLLGFMLVIDAGTMIAALHIIGLNSAIFGLLPVVVVYYSLYLGYAGGIASATVSSLGFSGLVIAKGQVSDLENRLAILPLLYVLALLVGYVSQQRFRETQERQALQQLISAESNAKSLLDLAQALAGALDPATIANDMASVGALVTRARICVIFRHDSARDVLVLQGSSPEGALRPAKDGKAFEESLEPGSFLHKAWTSRGPAFLDQGDGPHIPDWVERLGSDGAFALPITNGGQKIGLACFIGAAGTSVLGDGAAEALDAFSPMAGRYLANSRLYSEAHRRSGRVAAQLQQDIESAGRFRELSQRRTMKFGPLSILPARESVRWEDTSIRLTRTEFDLLYVLADKAGSVVNQGTLTREVWGPDYVPQGKVVDVTIHRLRRKLEPLPSGNKLIRTVRGQGYSFTPPGSGQRSSDQRSAR